MRKYICDICEDENDKSINVIDIPCHHWTFHGKAGYSDGLGNTVSGRKDHVDVCNECYNIAWFAATQALRDAKDGKEQPTGGLFT